MCFIVYRGTVWRPESNYDSDCHTTPALHIRSSALLGRDARRTPRLCLRRSLLLWSSLACLRKVTVSTCLRVPVLYTYLFLYLKLYLIMFPACTCSCALYWCDLSFRVDTYRCLSRGSSLSWKRKVRILPCAPFFQISQRPDISPAALLGSTAIFQAPEPKKDTDVTDIIHKLGAGTRYRPTEPSWVAVRS